MKKKNILFLSILLLSGVLFNSSPVWAISDTALEVTPKVVRQTTRAQERIEQVESQQQENQERLQERKEELVGKLNEMKKQSVERIVNRIRNRLEARFQKLGLFEDRISQRAGEKEVAGQDMTQTRNRLMEMNTYRNQYENDMTEVQTELDELLESETPREELTGVKEAIKRVRITLGEMRMALVRAAQSLVQN
jgi:hypothetical protein